MGLLQLIAQVWSPSQHEEALDRVVRRSTSRVLASVGRTPLAMSTAEARGFVRAHAIGETRRQVSGVVEEFPRMKGQEPKLLKEALPQVTRVVLSLVREELRTRLILKKAA